ncbi:MAG: signal peptidase II [Lawsonella sp.]
MSDVKGASEPDSAAVTQEAVKNRQKAAKKHFLLYGLAGLIVVLDFLSKGWIVSTLELGETAWSKGIFSITRVHNTGAAFSLGSNATVAITIVSLIIATFVASALWRTDSWWWGIGLSLILGGAIGNLIDRFSNPPEPFSGYVVDFISVGSFPVFNVADSAVTIGVVVTVLCIIFGPPLRTRKGDN